MDPVVMTQEQKMWAIREEERVVEYVTEFLKEHNRFYHAAQVMLMYSGMKDYRQKCETRVEPNLLQSY